MFYESTQKHTHTYIHTQRQNHLAMYHGLIQLVEHFQPQHTNNKSKIISSALVEFSAFYP